MQIDYLTELSLRELRCRYPVVGAFFRNLNLPGLPEELNLMDALDTVDSAWWDEYGLSPDTLSLELTQYLDALAHPAAQDREVDSVTILGGRDKDGNPEPGEVTVRAGEVVSIVGPTGSGKSRLLEDIECAARGDTPTGRRVLVDGRALEDSERFETAGKLVAQLSQNMNFVMDLTVGEFLEMHAVSRLLDTGGDTLADCLDCANDLAGEPFAWDTKITQLSGGQSRALMIADTALLSASPIVLIDEIENAGVDRRRAIALLASREKIVFVATHDPLLALEADRRLVIKNGGIHRVLETDERERMCLEEIARLDSCLTHLRTQLREGGRIDHVGDLRPAH